MSDFSLRKNDRVLGLFPHPDDESLGAGILLQRAAASGAAILPVFLTSGEANAWPQRVLDRKLFLTDEDRRRFAVRREQEARKALAILGVTPGSAVFLRFPDAALTSRLVADGQSLLAPIIRLLAEFQPTVVLAPVLADCHPDHSATAVLALALRKQQETQTFRLLAYPTHVSLTSTGEITVITGTEAEKARKRRAIAAHSSQLVFRRRFHLRFAQAAESYWPITAAPETPVKATVEGNRLQVRFCLPLSFRSLRTPVVTVVTVGEKLEGFSLPIGRPGGLPLSPPLRHWQQDGRSVTLSLQLTHAPELVLVKVNRPFFLYDEMGFVLAAKASV